MRDHHGAGHQQVLLAPRRRAVELAQAGLDFARPARLVGQELRVDARKMSGAARERAAALAWEATATPAPPRQASADNTTEHSCRRRLSE